MAGLFDMIAGNGPSTQVLDPSQQAVLSQYQAQQYNPGVPLPDYLQGPPQGAPQPAATNAPVNVPNHSLTGILGIHGVPGQLINWLGDTIATAAGMQLPFKDDPAKRAQASAMQDFVSNPMAAVQRLAATGDTQAATGLYNNVVQAQHNNAMLDLDRQRTAAEVAATKQKIDDTVRSQAGKVISSATPDTYEGLYGHVNDVFGKKADLTPLGLFNPSDVSKYTTTDPTTGKKSWTPEGQAVLNQANTFNVPEYRYLGTDAAQIAANARAQQAATGASVAPSTIRKNNAIADAAPVAAAAQYGRTGAQQEQVNLRQLQVSGWQPGQPLPAGFTPEMFPNGVPQVIPGKSSNRRPAPGTAPVTNSAPSAQPAPGQQSPPFPPGQYKGKSKWDPQGHEWRSNGQIWIRMN